MGSSIYTFPLNGVIPPVLRKVLHLSMGALSLWLGFLLLDQSRPPLLSVFWSRLILPA